MGTVIGGGLKSFLHRQAREQAMNVTAEAQDLAASITAEGQRLADAEAAAVRSQFAETIQATRRRAITQARLTAKLALARKQGEVAEQLWEHARQRLAQWSPEQRQDSLRALLLDAAHQLGGGKLVITTNQADQAVVRALMPGLADELAALGVAGAQVADEVSPIWGGLLVRRQDTNWLVDNSWNRRLELVKRVRRDDVFRLLS
jgi:vacuolar-type H+-ATPase subunit E/Vma4